MNRRWIPLALLLTLCLAAYTAPSVATAGPAWTAVITDGHGDVAAGDAPVPAPDPRLDLAAVSFANDPGWLHVKVETLASATPDDAPVAPPTGTPVDQTGPVTVTVGFAVERENGTAGASYRLVVEDGPTFTLYRGSDIVPSVAFQSNAGATPWDFEVRFPRTALGEVPVAAEDRLAFVEAYSEGAAGAHDRAPNTDYGTYTLSTDANGTTIPTWVETTGVDFAGGPSVSSASDGTLHVAYYVYRADRGTATGIWHGTMGEDVTGRPTVVSSHVGSGTFAAGDEANSRDAQTQVALALDDTDRPHLLYLSDPGSADGALRYAVQDGSSWTTESPNALADGTTLDTTGGYRSVPAIDARAGRIVAAFQSEDLDTIAIVERQSDGWHLVRELSDARFPKLALDSDGTIRLAFFRETSDQSPNRGNYGRLMYVEERANWVENQIADEVIDLSKFWETTETDGSFAFAIGPKDRSYFVYETDHAPAGDERGFVVWDGGEVSREKTPLTPVHGNPQLRMRMAIDAQGNAHMVTGYGGADLYGMRAANGAWLTQAIDRGDLFAMTVTPDGRAVTTYTQPHGGTTLAVSAQVGQAKAADPGPDAASDEEEPEGAPGDWESVPSIGFPLMTLGALGGLLLLTGGVRSGLDRRPGWFAPAFAALGGFSRIKKDALLENKTRDDIVEAIRAHPGVAPTELRRRLDIPRSTFFYHLSRLEAEGLVRSHRDHGRLWLFTPEATRSTPSPPVQDALLRATQAEPGRTAAEYAERLGRSRRTILHHLQELERRDAVTRFTINPREVRWGIMPDADLEEGG